SPPAGVQYFEVELDPLARTGLHLPHPGVAGKRRGGRRRAMATWTVSRRTVLAGAAAGLASASPLRAFAAAADPIPIGVLTPLTGAGGPFGAEMQKAITGAVERINAAGGPLGRRIRLFVEDSQTNPEAAVRGVKKLIDVNRVVAVIGSWASGETLAVAPIC